MTEQEWLASADPVAMLRWITRRGDVWHGQADGIALYPVSVSDRKLRLFSCACALASGARTAGTAYEQMLIDGQALSGNFEYGHDPKRLAEIWCDHDGLESLILSRHRPSRHPTKSARADLLRHIFGNPFLPMLIARLETVPGEAPERWADPSKAAKLYRPAKPPHWLNSTVIDLAYSLYAGEHDAAGALHDALLDAGAPHELVEHFAEFVPCQQCSGTGWREDVAGEDLDGRGGRVVNVRCEHDDSLVPMVQKYNDGGTSYWFNLLEPSTRHLTPERAQPKHPKGCWAIDLILGKE